MPTTIHNQPAISMDNITARYWLFSRNSFADGGTDNHRFVVCAQGAQGDDALANTVERNKRWPRLNTERASFFEGDSCDDSKFFAFANVDCFSPIAIIRANSFESAYEAFCDEFSDWLKIAEEDMKDYIDHKSTACEQPDYTCSYSASGVPIDTDQVQGFRVYLVSVEV